MYRGTSTMKTSMLRVEDKKRMVEKHQKRLKTYENVEGKRETVFLA